MAEHKLDIRAVIHHLGGARNIVNSIAAIGHKEITIGGIEKWRERESITSDRLLTLLAVAKHQDITLDISDFILKN